MILDHLDHSRRYAGLHPRFAAAFAFLRRPDLAALATGRHAIDEDDTYAIVQRGPGRPRAQALLETHATYIDIQYLLAGAEEMGWTPGRACRHPTGPHDTEKDIRFYNDPPACTFDMPPGSFAIFFPEDAHRPSVGAGEIHKIVIKVRA